MSRDRSSNCATLNASGVGAIPDERRANLTIYGYFDDIDKLADAVMSIRHAKGIYFTINPCIPELLAKINNRLAVAMKGEATGDTNIVRRRWILIDLDPKRPVSDISSTDAEHELALERAEGIAAFLRGAGLARPDRGRQRERCAPARRHRPSERRVEPRARGPFPQRAGGTL